MTAFSPPVLLPGRLRNFAPTALVTLAALLIVAAGLLHQLHHAARLAENATAPIVIRFDRANGCYFEAKDGGIMPLYDASGAPVCTK